MNLPPTCAPVSLKPGQKELLSKYLYDDVGSALFEVICQLPEYGLTRADERLLRRHAHDIVQRLATPVAVAELGSGSGRKTRHILEALCRRQRTSYYPIEISPTALAMCERELRDIESISILGFEREYLDGLLKWPRSALPASTCSYCSSAAPSEISTAPPGLSFLPKSARFCKPGDSLLLGTDLEKSHSQLIAAYDDQLGVTAAFNLNLLNRINRELEADFDVAHFEHVAKINHQTRSVEMHLRSMRAQTVNIAAAELTVNFVEGETIWTESSHKYSLQEVFSMSRTAGFRCDAQWIDDQWPFAENLARC